MILLFTKKYGKISAGTGINEKGKSKAALAMRPFTYGNYQLYKNKDYYNIDSAEVVKSYYKIGENVDKYMCSSFALELTEKVIPEDQPNPKIFNLIIDFFDAIENREKRFETLVIAYEVKLLQSLGIMPEIKSCACCGAGGKHKVFSVADGGIICENCANNVAKETNDTLIYEADFGIVDILEYFASKSLASFEKIALEEATARKVQRILKSYISYHLDVGDLKSESFFRESF